MHGAGNDYLYVDGRGQERDWPALSAAMSDRHTGVGSDGLIVLMPSDDADLRMTMFNADGSEGRMCGNGIRCLVAFAMDHGMVPQDRERVYVDTLSGMRWVEPVWENGRFSAAVVGMGRAHTERRGRPGSRSPDTRRSSTTRFRWTARSSGLAASRWAIRTP